MPLRFPFLGVRRGSPSEQVPGEFDQLGNLYVASFLPGLAHLVNSGAVWSVAEATGVNSVIALPTTTAQISLYNNSPASGEGAVSYVMLRATAIVTASPAGLSQFGMAHCVHALKPTTRPTADIAAASIINMKPLSGAYKGNAIVDLAATVVDDLWKPLGYSNVNAVTGVGWQVDVWMDGLVIIPPGGLYSLVTVAQATSVQTRAGCTWAEVKL